MMTKSIKTTLKSIILPMAAVLVLTGCSSAGVYTCTGLSDSLYDAHFMQRSLEITMRKQASVPEDNPSEEENCYVSFYKDGTSSVTFHGQEEEKSSEETKEDGITAYAELIYLYASNGSLTLHSDGTYTAEMGTEKEEGTWERQVGGTLLFIRDSDEGNGNVITRTLNMAEGIIEDGILEITNENITVYYEKGKGKMIKSWDGLLGDEAQGD